MIKMPDLKFWKHINMSKEFQAKLNRSGAYIAILAVIISLACTLFVVFRPLPKPPRATEETQSTLIINARAKNFFTLWATGKPSDEAALKSMWGGQNDTILLNEYPVEVYDVDILFDNVTEESKGSQHDMVLGASFVAPGARQRTRNYFRLQMFSAYQNHKTVVKAITLPTITNWDSPSASFRLAYSTEMSPDSKMFQSVREFVSSYYNSSSDIRKFLTGTSTISALQDSPYISADLLSIKIQGSGTDTEGNNAKAGDQATILITVRGNLSSTTYQTMQSVLIVQKQANGLWLVDKFQYGSKLTNVTVNI